METEHSVFITSELANVHQHLCSDLKIAVTDVTAKTYIFYMSIKINTVEYNYRNKIFDCDTIA